MLKLFRNKISNIKNCVAHLQSKSKYLFIGERESGDTYFSWANSFFLAIRCVHNIFNVYNKFAALCLSYRTILSYFKLHLQDYSKWNLDLRVNKYHSRRGLHCWGIFQGFQGNDQPTQNFKLQTHKYGAFGCKKICDSPNLTNLRYIARCFWYSP